MKLRAIVALGLLIGGCSSTKAVPENDARPEPIVVYPASESTQRTLGVSSWAIRYINGAVVWGSEAADGTETAYLSLRVNPDDAMRYVTMTFASGATNEAGQLAIAKEGAAVLNHLPPPAQNWLEHAGADLKEFKKAQGIPYGCVGDTLWLVGGCPAGVAVCAGVVTCLGGLAAGCAAPYANLWEDHCFPQPKQCTSGGPGGTSPGLTQASILEPLDPNPSLVNGPPSCGLVTDPQGRPY